MRTVEMKKAKESFLDYAKQARIEPLIFTDLGKPRIALFSIENSDWESIVLSLNPKFKSILERSRLSIQQKGGISLEDVRKRIKEKKRKPR